MNDNNKHRDGVPEDYPGRIVRFPNGTDHLVLMVLGAQGDNDPAQADFVTNLIRLSKLEHGPQHLERGRHLDSSGVPTNIILAYWTDPDITGSWWESEAVSQYWNGLPLDGDSGFFFERMNIPCERFNYAAGTEDRHGSAAILPLQGSSTFGYWGAYRDRIPASVNDNFESPLATVPASDNVDTKGRRLSVRIPDNICYIREGQGWANCGPEERQIWDEQMNGVIDTWVERLGSDPTATGCLCVRDCSEVELDSGDSIGRRTQIAFLLSLRHIEQAARTDPAHLAVHGAFVKMYTEPRFTPRMHVWVELGIMKRDEVETEYLNCHPQTGLLPYFETSEL